MWRTSPAMAFDAIFLVRPIQFVAFTPADLIQFRSLYFVSF